MNIFTSSSIFYVEGSFFFEYFTTMDRAYRILSAGMAHPRMTQILLPCGKEIARLTARRITIKQQPVRADIVFLLQGSQCPVQGTTRPDLRFPVVVVFQAGRHYEDSVLVAPLAPTHLTGSVRYPIGIASSEDHQNTTGFPRIITTRHPILEHSLLILWSTGLDLDRVGRKT